MEEKVRKELQAIRGMVLTWKKSYLREAPPEGGGEFLVEDLNEQIGTFVYPYMKRLYETKNISESEMREFLDFCYDEVEGFRNSLKELENPWLSMGNQGMD
jgi:hypothetical protein